MHWRHRGVGGVHVSLHSFLTSALWRWENTLTPRPPYFRCVLLGGWVDLGVWAIWMRNFVSADIDPPVRSARCLVTIPSELSAFSFECFSHYNNIADTGILSRFPIFSQFGSLLSCLWPCYHCHVSSSSVTCLCPNLVSSIRIIWDYVSPSLVAITSSE